MTKDGMQKYLRHVMSYYGTYHNHKETSAWAAVFIFVFISLQFLSVGREIIFEACWFKIFCTFMLVMIMIAVILFIHEQLALKKLSSNVIAACLLLETEILKESEEDFSKRSFKIEPRGCGKHQLDHVLPEFIMTKTDCVHGGEPGITLDKIKYLLIIIVYGLFVVRIWWPN
ncbi:MAG: hypothetical protein ACOYU2_05885 [Nitrospirota bacterium]